jgi:hypothetical protein
MKGAFAIFLSLLLIGTQTAFMAARSGPLSSQTQIAKCCHPGAHCYKSCCLARENSRPVSSPIAPSRAASQADSQLLVAPLALAMRPAPTFPSGLISSDFSARPMTALPLYQRTCSYLI